ncbi:MAG TPA: hypothetical protein VMU75_08990 [Acidimicrobiales bacterium]|nr:hypothetical protein [Acidimicrobiales bacterium]
MGSLDHGANGDVSPMVARRILISWSLVGAFAVVLAAGYILRWHWTGFQQHRQLWDLLHLIVLPLVLATLPLWFRTRARWHVQWRFVFAAVLAAFVVLVIGGYALGWTWTGFQGNTLWDWLELLALPVVVALLPLWFETHRRLEARWRIAFALVASTFVVIVVGGYALDWTWTGFEGNTLLQWMRLLFMPFILPASIAWFSTRAELESPESRPPEHRPATAVRAPVARQAPEGSAAGPAALR